MANYTILLIDYEPRSIERFRQPLVGAGYVVEVATDGVSGIEAFHRLNPDMVLVEAMIPKKHGFEVCQELKRTPHGRRTPVIITTGVYKGRKYRTQALHIYGCDEYIEKPIAPEQLLEIVSRFLKPGTSAPSPHEVESAPAVSEPGSEPGPQHKGGSVVKSAPSAESPAPGSQRTKPTSIPQAHVKDDTEDEIMACLDAILPSGGGAIPIFAEPDTIAVVAAVEQRPEAPAEVVTVAQQDPFAQMRAELDAELGSLSAALEFEPAPTLEPMPEPTRSDQVVSPSVLEALPVPETEIPGAPQRSETPVVTGERPGQLVSFDSKRSRKNKKTERQDKRRSTQSVPPAQVALAPESVPSKAMEAPVPVSELTLPRGTLVESELESAPPRRGAPVWIWAAVGVVAIVTLYVVFSRGGVEPPDTSSSLTPTTDTSESAPAAATSPEVVSTAIPAPPPAPEPSSIVLDGRKPVSNALKVPVTKKPLDRENAPTSPVATSGRAPAAATPAPTHSAAPLPRPQPAVVEPVKLARPEAPVSSGLDDDVAGVETLPDSAAAAPATALAPGTLVPIDEADVMPVNLSRKLPTYSMQARQMRLRGTVMMNVLVNERGTVDQVVLVTGVAGADLNDSAMRAAKSWTYRPATKHGVPVKVWKSEQIVFKL